MISISEISSSVIEKGRRILKAIEIGAKTAYEVSSFGNDSVPLKGMKAIYAQTSEKGDAVIVGYINEHQKSKSGENRMYSLKPDGSESFDIYLKSDGTCEIGGNTDNFVKFIPLNIAITAKDSLINAELAKIATAINSIAPGAYVASAVSTDLSTSKTDNIKTS